MTLPATLTGKRILVTRPQAQAEHLCHLIEAAGGMAVRFPVVEIADPEDFQVLDAQLRALANNDLTIFISPTSVARALQRIAAWPQHLMAAAVGPGSAAALRRRGVGRVLAPVQGNDSEALLALPEMQAVAGKRILILRGQGGRELLGDTLRARGAVVDYAECYRRVRPAQFDVSVCFPPPHAIVLTSREGLENFRDMLGVRWAELSATPVFAPHPRIVEAALTMGMQHASAYVGGDAGCIEAILSGL